MTFEESRARFWRERLERRNFAHVDASGFALVNLLAQVQPHHKGARRPRILFTVIGFPRGDLMKAARRVKRARCNVIGVDLKKELRHATRPKLREMRAQQRRADAATSPLG